MLNAIEGFSQLALVEFCTSGGIWLDVIDLVILRWFVIMRGLTLMEKLTKDGDEYVWIAYRLVIDHIPFLGLRTTDAIARRFSKYVRAGLLRQLIRRLGKGRGCKAYYAPTDKLRELFIKKEDALGSKTDCNRLRSDEKSSPDPDEKSGQSNKKREEKNGNKRADTSSPLQERHLRLAEVLAKHVESRDEKKFHRRDREKTVTRWADSIRKLEELDGRSPDEIEGVLNWVIKDSFWSGNILSGEKLREKFSDLKIKMGDNNGSPRKRKKLWCPKCQKYEESTSPICLDCQTVLIKRRA